MLLICPGVNYFFKRNYQTCADPNSNEANTYCCCRGETLESDKLDFRCFRNPLRKESFLTFRHQPVVRTETPCSEWNVLYALQYLNCWSTQGKTTQQGSWPKLYSSISGERLRDKRLSLIHPPFSSSTQWFPRSVLAIWITPPPHHHAEGI